MKEIKQCLLVCLFLFFQLDKGYDTMQEELVNKGKELNEFREKNNIRLVTEKEALELRQTHGSTASR